MMIPVPTWMTPAELAQYNAEMAALEADSRTAGGANRPAYLVKRVLDDARIAGKL